MAVRSSVCNALARCTARAAAGCCACVLFRAIRVGATEFVPHVAGCAVVVGRAIFNGCACGAARVPICGASETLRALRIRSVNHVTHIACGTMIVHAAQWRRLTCRTSDARACYCAREYWRAVRVLTRKLVTGVARAAVTIDSTKRGGRTSGTTCTRADRAARVNHGAWSERRERAIGLALRGTATRIACITGCNNGVPRVACDAVGSSVVRVAYGSGRTRIRRTCDKPIERACAQAHRGASSTTRVASVAHQHHKVTCIARNTASA